VDKIYSFEILSSTEWNFPQSFSPNVYINIEETFEIKLEAIKAYSSELRSYPHPRSLEGIRIKAMQRGMESGFRFAEAFELVRSLQV
jgi:LmbE family N-acetylglucosaminyl deacetylase